MAKWLSVLAACVIVAVFAVPAMAQDAPAGEGASGEAAGMSLSGLAAIGAGIVLVGAGLGIGKIGAAAAEGIARQPEFGNNIQTAMIISAALIEGAALFGLIICLMSI